MIAALGLSLAAAAPATARDGGSTAVGDSGGTGIPQTPRISGLACRTHCPGGASRASSATLVQVGSQLRVTGAGLDDVRTVLFEGGKEATPTRTASSSLDVVVPAGAGNGRVVVVARYGVRSKPSASELRVKPGTAGLEVVSEPNGSSLPSLGMPLPRGYLMTSTFWEPRSYELHPGVDLAISDGTPIKAAGAGVVTTAAASGGYGNYICIRHTAVVSSCYAHERSMSVDVGDRVRRGEVIGRVGCTGNCSGSHLHFEIRIRGAVVCPAPWVGARSSIWCEPASPGFGTRSVSARALARSKSARARSVAVAAASGASHPAELCVLPSARRT